MDAQGNVVVRDLVLVGGGHAHVQTIKMFGMKPIIGVRVTLISRDLQSPYSGMLPGYIAGCYSYDDCHIDLVRLCAFAQVRMLHVEAVGLDLQQRLVFVNDGRPPISYDLLSIDIGISPKPMQSISRNPEIKSRFNVTAVKPIDSFARRWNSIIDRVRIFANRRDPQGRNNLASPNKAPFTIAIVGGGAGGTELSFAIHYRLMNEFIAIKKAANQGGEVDFEEIRREFKIVLVHKGAELLADHCRSTIQLIKKEKHKNLAVCLPS